jgi:hypothetical protein
MPLGWSLIDANCYGGLSPYLRLKTQFSTPFDLKTIKQQHKNYLSLPP